MNRIDKLLLWLGGFIVIVVPVPFLVRGFWSFHRVLATDVMGFGLMSFVAFRSLYRMVRLQRELERMRAEDEAHDRAVRAALERMLRGRGEPRGPLS